MPPIGPGRSPKALTQKKIDFLGNDLNPYEVNKGQKGSVNADIVSDELRQALGQSNVPVDFDLGNWSVMEKVDGSTMVHVRGRVGVIDNEGGVFAGVVGSVSSQQERPLLVGYRPFADGGSVMYTTFHYHAQPNQRMLDVLRVLIFHLEG